MHLVAQVGQPRRVDARRAADIDDPAPAASGSRRAQDFLRALELQERRTGREPRFLGKPLVVVDDVLGSPVSLAECLNIAEVSRAACGSLVLDEGLATNDIRHDRPKGRSRSSGPGLTEREAREFRQHVNPQRR